MNKFNSFGRAVYEGDISGPEHKVVDNNTGNILPPQVEAGPHTGILREVAHRVTSQSGVELGHVVDYQHPETDVVAAIKK